MMQSEFWTDEDEARLFQGRLNKVPYRVLALQLGRSLKSCECKYRETDWTKKGFINDTYQKSRELRKEEIVQSLNNAYDNKLENMRLRADVIADRICSTIPSFPKAPEYYVPSHKIAKQDRSPEDAGLIISDIHIGLEHTLEETGGLSEYNFDVITRRKENLKKGVREITELHSNLYRIPTLHLFVLGDIVHGMNAVGKWSAAYIGLPVVDQMTAGVKMLGEMIYYWLGLFENIQLHCIGGNHGRSADKGVEKEYVNWDFVAYQMLEVMFADNPRVKINAPKTWWMQPTIRNHRFLLMHGEDVKGGNFPVKSLMNVETKFAGLTGEWPHYTLIGHFHNAAELSTNHGRILVNGSFVGADVHSLKSIQAGGKPEQKFFGIHDTRGITWSYNIDLESPRD